MSIRLAVNGFGRIGRLVTRALYESGRNDTQIVAINDLGDVKTNAHLLQYDSVHGRFPNTVSANANDNTIDFGRGPVTITSERDPAKLPWKELDVDIVLECTGFFTNRDDAAKHLSAGAKRVLISAPGKQSDLTVVYGVNHQDINDNHLIISNASCTTNCLAPVASVLQKIVGIEHGYMTTIHAYTGDQPVLDTLHKDLRRARAAASSMIPTTTGAAKAVSLVLPELEGKLDGSAIRVPTPNVSLVDLVFEAEKQITAEEINEKMIEASQTEPLNGILGICDQPLVSSDFNHDKRSSIFDVTQTQVIDGKLCRVVSWYDNEWGFSNRMLDTASCIGKTL